MMKLKIEHFFKNSNPVNFKFTACFVLMLVLTLPGCQQHAQENSQVIAKVNKEEITVHQLNAATVESLNQTSPHVVDKNVLLNKLIEDSLLKQALIKNQLHQPSVVQSLTNALVKAYADVYRRLFLENVITPTDRQITDYLKKHPEFFEQRQLFEIFEITFNTSLSIDDINFLGYQADSMNVLKEWLKEHRLDTYHRTTFVTTENLRPEFLKHGFLKSGSAIILFTDDDGYKRLQFATPVKFVPITGNEALMFARENLIKELRNERLQHEISRLKAIAAIEVLTTR